MEPISDSFNEAKNLKLYKSWAVVENLLQLFY